MKALKSFVITLLALIILCGVAFGVGWGITGTYDVRQWFQTQPDEGEQGGDNEGTGNDSSNNGNNGGSTGNNNNGNNGNSGDDKDDGDNNGSNNGGNNDEDNNVVSVAVDERLIVRLENSEGLSLMCTKIMPNDYKAYGITTLADCAFFLKATVKDENGNAAAGMQYATFLTYTDGGGVPPDYVISGRAIDDTTYLIIVDDFKSFGFLTRPGMNKQICVMVLSRLDDSKTAFARLEYKAV